MDIAHISYGFCAQIINFESVAVKVSTARNLGIWTTLRLSEAPMKMNHTAEHEAEGFVWRRTPSCGLLLDNFGWLLKPETGEWTSDVQAVACSVSHNLLSV